MDSKTGLEMKFEAGFKTLCGAIPVLNLKGSWRQMGRQYGFLMKEELRKVYDFAMRHKEGFDRLGQLGRGGKPVGIFRYDQLFRGVAETSGLTLEQLMAVNAVEVIYLDRIQTGLRDVFDGNRCSSLAVWPPFTREDLIFGRNYDWLPEFAELTDTLSVGVYHPADGAIPVASINWAGCFYMTTGMNANGLFVELNSGMFADDNLVQQRIHNVWLLWEFLLNAERFCEIENAFATCAASGTYLIGVADSVRAECFGWHTRGPAHTAPHEPGLLAMTNHFVVSGWKNLPGADLDGCASSIQRRAALLDLAHGQTGLISEKEMFEMISRPASLGGACVKGTLFQIVALPGKKLWYVKTKGQEEWSEICLAPFFEEAETPS